MSPFFNLKSTTPGQNGSFKWRCPSSFYPFLPAQRQIPSLFSSVEEQGRTVPYFLLGAFFPFFHAMWTTQLESFLFLFSPFFSQRLT